MTWFHAAPPSQAHPRWRGEHFTVFSVDRPTPGSSPLARGAQNHWRLQSFLFRLIPAGAGSTSLSPYPTHPTAHPRWRGEHATSHAAATFAAGSSPLARGAPPASTSHPESNRLIPAGAGSTSARVLACCRSSAHPRWRGEHCGMVATLLSLLGSSPLARGAPQAQSPVKLELRLIPAGAGSTAHAHPNTPDRAAHPRWRGEHEFHLAQLGF